MTLSILGDSISAFEGTVPKRNPSAYPWVDTGVTDVSQMWWSILIRKRGIELYCNESFSGARVSNTALLGYHSTCCSEIRQANLGGSMIIVFAGTNDWGLPHPPDMQMFTDAYLEMMDKTINGHPFSRCYFCTPVHRLDFKEGHRNKYGITLDEFCDRIRELVNANRRAHLIDLNKYKFTEKDGYLFDGLHPTALGMQKIAQWMEREIWN